MQVGITRGYLPADQPTPFRHVSFSLISPHVRENASPELVRVELFIGWLQGWHSSEFSSQNVRHGNYAWYPRHCFPIVSSHPLAENYRDILWVEARSNPSVDLLRGPLRNKHLILRGSSDTQASVVTAIAINCYIPRVHPSEQLPSLHC